MRVLMFGWEFPPFSSGGLGSACYGLARALSRENIDITFVLPQANPIEYDFMKVIAANIPRLKLRGIKSMISGYATSHEYEQKIFQMKMKADPSLEIYGQNLIEEVERYANKAAEIAREEAHDLIHAHDWLTFKAGIAAKKASGKPLVVHVHATEFDRTGGHGVNQYVYDAEREGMHAADAIIAVSNYTKSKIIRYYAVSPEKVHVVHNAIDIDSTAANPQHKTGKVVLYLGRVTLQKGPDYFVDAAKKVLEKEPDARFIIAGKGDMETRLINKAASLGISDRVLFTGFLRDSDIAKAYSMASLYVMPSVSEPFGITPLEAAGNCTPVMISKQSGVSEVLNHCLRVDFWDVNEMANKILAVLHHRELQEALTENSFREVSRMSWASSAKKCMQVYEAVK